MPTYVATGRDTTGRTRREKVVAATPGEARTMLKERGVFIENIKQDRGLNFNLEDIQTSLTQVSVKDKAVFSRQFAALVSAGVGLVRGIGILGEQCPNPKLKKALLSINADVQQGNNLSDSMRKHPGSFDLLYVSMVQAGEVGGVLDDLKPRLK
ncbi:MAG: type II secretion system F family protein, partial [Cyanobacteria bacterium J06642_11]